jgi:hypothetical protein
MADGSSGGGLAARNEGNVTKSMMIGGALLFTACAVLPTAALGQWECATVVVSDQQVAPDPGGDDFICTLRLCLDPPPEYFHPGSWFTAYPQSSGGMRPVLLGASTPEGWSAEFNPGGVFWLGPHIEDITCGFGMVFHVSSGMDRFCVRWTFHLLEDFYCGDSLCIEVVPAHSEPITWGRVKTLFR